MHRYNLLVHAGGAALADLLLLGLLLVDTLVHELGVLVLGVMLVIVQWSCRHSFNLRQRPWRPRPGGA